MNYNLQNHCVSKESPLLKKIFKKIFHVYFIFFEIEIFKNIFVFKNLRCTNSFTSANICWTLSEKQIFLYFARYAIFAMNCYTSLSLTLFSVNCFQGFRRRNSVRRNRFRDGVG